MNQIVQAAAFDVQDAAALGPVMDQPQADAPRPAAGDAVEFGSGWYHEAAISASAQAPAGGR